MYIASALRSALRPLATLACGVLAVGLLASTAHATPITYNLTLTANPGQMYSGTGSFTIETAPASTGTSDYTVANGKLDAINIVIGGQTFNLTNSTGNALVRFLNGTLNDITFAANTGSTPNRFSFQSTANYIFYYNNLQSSSTGTFTAAVAPTPEPSSLLLLATGLAGSAGACYRRFKARQMA